MSVYNNGPYVGDAIDSILAQSFGDFEFLIVDDRSTDNSGEVIADRAARDPRIRIVRCAEKGRVPALNDMFAQAAAPWVAIMDGDDISTPDRLERQMAFARANPACGVVGCCAYLIGPDGRPLGNGGGAKPVSHAEVLANLEDKPLINHNAALIARDPVLAIGGYRRAYLHAEDYDLWVRLVDRVEIAGVEEELVAYRIYPDQVSTRHVVTQTINAAVGWEARRERLAGRPDPTEGLAEMPPVDALDALFGRAGVAAYVRHRVVQRVLFSPEVLAGDGYSHLLGHIADGGAEPGLWRVAARLLKSGFPRQAAGVALSIAKAG